jgi:hypothetical protein
MRLKPVFQFQIHLGRPQKCLIFKADSTTCGVANVLVMESAFYAFCEEGERGEAHAAGVLILRWLAY